MKTFIIALLFSITAQAQLTKPAPTMLQANPGQCDVRLTLTSGTPVTTSDVTAATNIYFTPYKGNVCALYNGSNRWNSYTFSEITLPVPSGTLNVYDVFARASSGTVAVIAVQWTNNTTRAQAISLQNGVYVQTGTTGNRWIGTFMQTGTSGQTEDSRTKRLLFNAYNRATREMKVVELTDSWTYSTALFRPFNNSSANRLEFVVGIAEDAVKATASAIVTNSGGTGRNVFIGIGYDSTNSTSAYINGYAVVTNTVYHTLNAFYEGTPGVGYHFLAPLEAGDGSDTQTWTGDGGQVFPMNGIIGEIRN